MHGDSRPRAAVLHGAQHRTGSCPSGADWSLRSTRTDAPTDTMSWSRPFSCAPCDHVASQGCRSNSSADARSTGSRMRHRDKKLDSPTETVLGSHCGISVLNAILNKSACGLSARVSAQGRMPVDKLSTVQPMLQMSDRRPTLACLMISGAMNSGVPLMLPTSAVMVADPRSFFSAPKSASFTVPAWSTRMLAGLRSRWTMPFLCR
mmetsp:Transcript_15817/g.37424  ORF Transcript_15817/g.37424 Transcript_15817/m.37424 type:complete len:206 (+) Transcript_15817:228-845(+)